MVVHESSIDFRRLIQDLADMYPFDVSEVVVTELVANALDAKATRIQIDYDPENKILVVEDNGQGMTAKQFEEYHDFAAGLKRRGTGIGFAGLGAKISFNIADRVITETKGKAFRGGSNWYLQSAKKLVWEEIQPTALEGQGTKVEVYFSKKSEIVYKTTSDIYQIIERQYLPLLDHAFLSFYHDIEHYSDELRFVINGKLVQPFRTIERFHLDRWKTIQLVKTRKVYGCGLFGLADKEYPIDRDSCGVLLCTYGKVIKADFFNQFPGVVGARILGIVEVPEFVNFLTAQKTDFARKGQFRKFESLMNPIRQNFIEWLRDEIGVESSEVGERDEAVKLERELKKIIEDVPEIANFFGFWARRHLLSQSADGAIPVGIQDGIEGTLPDGTGNGGEEVGITEPGDQPGEAPVHNEDGEGRANPISRTSKRGPKIAFQEDRDRKDLAWVEGTNIVINIGHPVYEKVKSSNRTKNIFYLFAIACAIQRFKNSEDPEQLDLNFVDRMMAAWGSR